MVRVHESFCGERLPASTSVYIFVTVDLFPEMYTQAFWVLMTSQV